VTNPSEASPIADWFLDGPEPALRGLRCIQCHNVVFPPRAYACPNPACFSTDFEPVTLSRRGTLWSYTDSQYAPPAPYPSGGDDYEPFALAAVELAAEKIIVLGQVVRGLGVDDLEVGMELELAVEPLADGTRVWKWQPTGSQARRN
jgi:uncharacterized OB-fold protein